MSPYDQLEKVFSRVMHLQKAINLLRWDFDLFNKNKNSYFTIMNLHSIKNAILRDDMLSSLIEAANENKKNLNGWQASNLDLIGRMHKDANSVPCDLIDAFYNAKYECYVEWSLAYNDLVDNKTALKSFETMCTFAQEVAVAKSESLQCNKL